MAQFGDDLAAGHAGIQFQPHLAERIAPLRALRAQAEARVALGDISGAIDRLRAAQSLVRAGSANDFIEGSVVDARLRQLQAQQREIAAALRSGK